MVLMWSYLWVLDESFPSTTAGKIMTTRHYPQWLRTSLKRKPSHLPPDAGINFVVGKKYPWFIRCTASSEWFQHGCPCRNYQQAGLPRLFAFTCRPLIRAGPKRVRGFHYVDPAVCFAWPLLLFTNSGFPSQNQGKNELWFGHSTVFQLPAAISKPQPHLLRCRWRERKPTR